MTSLVPGISYFVKHGGLTLRSRRAVCDELAVLGPDHVLVPVGVGQALPNPPGDRYRHGVAQQRPPMRLQHLTHVSLCPITFSQHPIIFLATG